MEIIENLKTGITEIIKKTEFGNRKFYRLKEILGKNPKPDITYPELISIEISSICNLSCIHCPPQQKEFSSQTRKHSHIDYNLFNLIMDDIDKNGKHDIALHKDGEPLVHPRILDILHRLKKNVSHNIYLTTNAQNLNPALIDTILENRIDIVNFSIGASSEEFYKKVRGRGFNKVMNNINNFLLAVSKGEWKPKVIVQIIDLPEFAGMKEEINNFKKYWKNHNVQIAVWKKLTWGVLEGNNKFKFRYPCYSLWHSFNINSNGIVTACCMDWKQELIIGNVNNEKIEDIWKGENLLELRKKHIYGEENNINACAKCNYWKWQPMLLKYPQAVE
jgi:radical SAM protein with 4Fe4S-binding SPASM domain